jgi:hypothetical protein
MTDANTERGEALDLYDDKVQEAICWTMRQWGDALGLKSWTQGDGSESVEGDVHAEIHGMLIDAGLRDPETNAMAAFAPTEAKQVSRNAGETFEARAVELVQKHGNPCGTDYEQGQTDMGHRMVMMAREADAIIAARPASVEDEGEVVAWLLTHPTEPKDVELASLSEPITDADRQVGWDAEPLYRRSLQAEARKGRNP